ncbi:hypothetical protein [Anaerosporobacter faecicola]|uniref:hypothetical protein n=1 Tax=Anaerosporobacter faecicola TaxID=2718714 RepID=UPI00143A8AA8|nr:hypothetical protein [Anaerosporobacter faecicola]
MLVAIAIFMILAFTSLLIRTRSSKTNKINQEEAQSFWEREQESNSVRKKDISNLPYITVPLDELPFHNSEDSSIIRYQDSIKRIAERKILNLSTQSNTDLKLNYGVANLPFLMDCDVSYTELIKTLQQWGKALLDSNQIDDAKTVLEFAVTCKTDIAVSYTLLGDIYAKQHNKEKIQSLLEVAKTINSPNQSNTVHYLEQLLSS